MRITLPSDQRGLRGHARIYISMIAPNIGRRNPGVNSRAKTARTEGRYDPVGASRIIAKGLDKTGIGKAL